MTDIVAGDSHTVAYNTGLNCVYIWGCYRNVSKGFIHDPWEFPTRYAKDILSARVRITKIVSGAHHSLMHTNVAATKKEPAKTKVFAWGCIESGKLGRDSNTRARDQQGLTTSPIHIKKAAKVFCGAYHSFVQTTKGELLAFGLNNFGQLGIGTLGETCIPTSVEELKDKEIVDLVGGEHHSMCLTDDGSVFVWGKNDEGQIGQGNTYTEIKQKHLQVVAKWQEERRVKLEEKRK